MIANTSLPLLPPASQDVTSVPEILKLELLSEESLLLDVNWANHNGPVDGGEETRFGPITRRVGESNNSMMIF